MTTERIDELIALAALGELSPSEERELHAVADHDPEVAQELQRALTVAASIQSVASEAPPASMRGRVLDAIGATPQDPLPEADGQADGQSDGRSNPVVSLEAGRRRRWMPILLGAAAAAVLVLGGVLLVVDDAVAPDGSSAVVEAPDAQTRVLQGEVAGVRVVASASEGALVVLGDGLPVLDDSATYQLWLVDDAGATSVGVFRPNADGEVVERFDDVDPTGFTLGVTREPAGGSESPTLPILASA